MAIFRYRHRKSRPLHEFRYGLGHYRQHRQGIRHGHRRSESATPVRRTKGSWRGVPQPVRLREFRFQLLRGVAVGAFAIFTWALLVGGYTLFAAQHNLRQAQHDATQIIDNRTMLLGESGRTLAATYLDDARRNAYEADHKLSDSAALHVLSWIPFLGTQVTSLTQDAHAVDVAAVEGQALLQKADGAANASHGTYVSLPDLAALDQQVHVSRQHLMALHQSASGLVGPVRTVREQLNAQLDTLTRLLGNAGDALNYAQPFLGSRGPRTYFVAGENNSEMRDQGSVLSWAVLHVVNGHFSMTRAASVGTLALQQPAAPITDSVTRSVFGALQPTRVWQNVDAVGDFPTSARWMLAMYHAATGTHLDGVLALDVVTLQNLLRLVGSVHISGVRPAINAGNVARLVLHDLYTRYPAGSQQYRHDEISSIAQATVDKMKLGAFDPAQLIKALSDSSPARHLLFYDTNPAYERFVTRFGDSGAILAYGPNVVHLAVESAVASKVDWYVQTNVRYDVRLDDHGTAYITTSVSILNGAPLGARPSYALGPDNINTHHVGEYVSRVYEWLPRGAQGPAVVHEEGVSLARTVVHVMPQSVQVAVLQGLIQHAVHHGVFSLTFIPQSSLRPAMATVTFTGSGGISGPLSTTFTADHVVTLRWSTH